MYCFSSLTLHRVHVAARAVGWTQPHRSQGNVESDVEWEGVLVCLSSTDDEWGRGARKRGSPHAPRLRGACVRCRPHAVHGVQVPLHGGLSSCTCCHRRLTHGRWWPALAVAGPLHAHHVERRANMLQQRFLVWATPGCVVVRASAACLYPRGNAMARSVAPPHVDVATQNAMNASLACTSCVLPARTGTTLSLCRPLTPPPTTPSIGVRVRQLPNPPQAQS